MGEGGYNLRYLMVVSYRSSEKRHILAWEQLEMRDFVDLNLNNIELGVFFEK